MTSSGLTQRKRNFQPDDSQSEFTYGDSAPKPTSSSSSLPLDDLNDEKKSKQLTLMEQVLLLGLKDSQGTLSFWNDNISYVLRGCILMELSFRNKIQIKREARKKPYQDRIIQVVDDSSTGEVLLDEALKYIKNDEDSVANWIDFLSGETWNLLKIGYQLKQVRERLAKGLVDKGVLRTEKKSFVVFDMATHPLSDNLTKKNLIVQVTDTLLSRGPPPDKRTIALICACYAANLLESIFDNVSHINREAAYMKADELLKEFSQINEKSRSVGITEIVAGVLGVYSKMDSIL